MPEIRTGDIVTVTNLLPAQEMLALEYVDRIHGMNVNETLLMVRCFWYDINGEPHKDDFPAIALTVAKALTPSQDEETEIDEDSVPF